MPDEKTESRLVLISGRVQGVGFRYWVLGQAQSRGFNGWVRNLPNGDVEALISGAPAVVADMLAAFWTGPTFSKVTQVTDEAGETPERDGFHILP